MFVPGVLPLLLSAFLSVYPQQLGLQEEKPRYYLIEIGPAAIRQPFEVEIVMVSRTGKEVAFKQLTCKSPYKLALYDETFLILHGKSGKAKMTKQWRLLEREQRSYQYLEKGEAVIVEFLPKPVGGGRTQSRSEGMRIAPRLEVTMMQRE
jgi:hypothetical protein